MSDIGNYRTISCETSEQFMNILDICNENLNSDQIEYTDITSPKNF